MLAYKLCSVYVCGDAEELYPFFPKVINMQAAHSTRPIYSIVVAMLPTYPGSSIIPLLEFEWLKKVSFSLL